MKRSHRVLGIWTAIGIGIGAAIGSAAGEMGISIALCAAFGIAVGRHLDKRSDFHEWMSSI